MARGEAGIERRIGMGRLDEYRRSGHDGFISFLDRSCSWKVCRPYDWWLMIRFVVGMSSGLAVCLVPPFLSVIARSTPQLASKTGLIGTMNQIGIVTGLFCGQVAGLILTGSVRLALTIDD